MSAALGGGEAAPPANSDATFVESKFFKTAGRCCAVTKADLSVVALDQSSFYEVFILSPVPERWKRLS